MTQNGDVLVGLMLLLMGTCIVPWRTVFARYGLKLLIVTIIAAVGAWWGFLAYLVYHFTTKYW